MLLRMLRLPLIVAPGLALLVGGTSLAGTANSDLTVTATIANNCTIATTTLAFGTYDPITTHKAANLDGTGAVTVTCTNGASVGITLGQGANADAGSTDAAPLRRMKSGSNYLSYSLFSDSNRSVVWGNTSETDVSDTGTGVESAHTVYGRIALDQNVPAGSYSDTVVATVTF